MLRQLPAEQPIEVILGDDFDFNIDLATPSSGKSLFSKLIINGTETDLTITENGTNIVSISIPASLTATITGSSSWKFGWSPSGKKRTLIRGEVKALKA